MQIIQEIVFLPIQDRFVLFSNKLQGANDFSEQSIVVSYVNDELRIRQHFFETSEEDTVK